MYACTDAEIYKMDHMINTDYHIIHFMIQRIIARISSYGSVRHNKKRSEKFRRLQLMESLIKTSHESENFTTFNFFFKLFHGAIIKINK